MTSVSFREIGLEASHLSILMSVSFFGRENELRSSWGVWFCLVCSLLVGSLLEGTTELNTELYEELRLVEELAWSWEEPKVLLLPIAVFFCSGSRL